nr:uncharacterized protein LOC104097690 [Nicotiana tomentosiformis]
MPTGRLKKWQILLTEFDIVYVTRTAMKARALAYHFAENPVDDDYKPLSTYFPNEKVNSIEEVVPDDNHVWKMYFDGAINIKEVGIRAILISPIGKHFPAMARLWLKCTNNTTEYEACIMGLKNTLDLDVHELLVMKDSDLLIRQDQGEWETRNIKLTPYRQCVQDLSKRFKSIDLRAEVLFCISLKMASTKFKAPKDPKVPKAPRIRKAPSVPVVVPTKTGKRYYEFRDWLNCRAYWKGNHNLKGLIATFLTPAQQDMLNNGTFRYIMAMENFHCSMNLEYFHIMYDLRIRILNVEKPIKRESKIRKRYFGKSKGVTLKDI